MKRRGLFLFYIFFITLLFLFFFFFEGRITGNAVKDLFTNFKNVYLIQPRLVEDSGRGSDVGGGFIGGDMEDGREEIASGIVYYVDHLLSEPCTDGTYSIALRTCGSGNDGKAYPHPQDLALIVKPGDIIYVREGTYGAHSNTKNRDRVIQIAVSGVEGRPIRYLSYKGEKVKLTSSGPIIQVAYDQKIGGYPTYDPPQYNYIEFSGFEVYGGTTGFDIRASLHIKIENNIIHDISGSGIIITRQGGPDGVNPPGGYHTIRNNEIYNCYNGIVNRGPYTLIERNLAYNNFKPSYGGDSDGIGSSADYVIIRKNVVFDNSDDAADIGRGQPFEGWGRGPEFNLIEDNVFFNSGCVGDVCGDGSGLKLHTLEGGLVPGGGFVVRNNIIFRNRLKGLDVSTRPGDSRPDLYYNNIIYDNGWDEDLSERNSRRLNICRVSGQDGIYIEKFNAIIWNTITINPNNEHNFTAEGCESNSGYGKITDYWDLRLNNQQSWNRVVSDYNFIGDRWLKDSSGRLLGDGCGNGDDGECLWDQNSLSGDPLFLDVNNLNVITDLKDENFGYVPGLALLSNSPAIDSGVPVNLAIQNLILDIQTVNSYGLTEEQREKWIETLRYNLDAHFDDYTFDGVAPDMGAYEYFTGNSFCGNNRKEEGEVCDGNDFGGETCVTQGFDYGDLICSQSCSFINTSMCVKEIDRDGDYLIDDWEIDKFGNLLQSWNDDFDRDNVVNLHEYHFRSDPKSQDSDGTGGDNVLDFDEIFIYYTNPNHWDTDYDHNGNGLKFDYDEIHTYLTVPFNMDSDGDGYEDGDEIDSGKNPFMKDTMRFTFIDGAGVEHVRSRVDLKYTDSFTGEYLDIIPWVEIGDRNTVFDGRDEIQYEIVKQGIVSWAKAGATKVGVVGAYGWMKDLDTNTQGYQNGYVEELSKLGRDNGIKVIFGMKLSSSFITSYDQFFHNGNQKFNQLKDLIIGLTGATGSSEFILEGETAYQGIVDAYYNNQFNLNSQDMQNFRNNMQILASTNVKIYMWAPFFYIDQNGNPKTIPQDRRNYREDLEGIYTQLSININSVLGDNYGYLGGQESNYVRAGQRQKPYKEDSIKVFKALQREGIYNYYQNKPVGPYLERGPGSILDAGPSELGVDIPRYYGKDLDNSNFRNLKFDKIFLYPGAFKFDWVGDAVANYFKNGISLSVKPYDSIMEGQPITIVFTVHDELNRNLDLKLDFLDPEKGITPDRDFPSVEIDKAKNQLKFLWIPEYHRGKNSKGIYWIKFVVKDNDGKMVAEQPVRIEVQNYGVNSLTTDLADFDSDGYSNKDEVANGNNPRDVKNYPLNDFDFDFISDITDIDDDNDAIIDDKDVCPYTPIEYRRDTSKFGCPIPEIVEFDEELTTKLYEEDLFNVIDFKVGKKNFGQIRFAGSVKLLRQENRNGRNVWVPIDLTSNIEIQQNKVTIHSDSLPELDKPAQISFYNIRFANPVILKDGKECKDCSLLSYSGGELVIGVVSFSTYEVVDGEGSGVCGNGVVENWEQCDDGNLFSGDGCNAGCQTESFGEGGGGSGGNGASGGGGISGGGNSNNERLGLEGGLACQDGIDNDGDGFIDWPEDDGCIDILDTSEESSVRNFCVESWSCSEWGYCVNGAQTRLCNDINSCGTFLDKPAEKRICLIFGKSERNRFFIWVLIISILILAFVVFAVVYERRKYATRVVDSPLMRHWIK